MDYFFFFLNKSFNEVKYNKKYHYEKTASDNKKPNTINISLIIKRNHILTDWISHRTKQRSSFEQ